MRSVGRPLVYSNAEMNMCLARFTYDERGQRLLKESNDGLGSVAQRTFCLRDVSGGEQYVLVQDDTQSTTSEQLPIRPPWAWGL